MLLRDTLDPPDAGRLLDAVTKGGMDDKLRDRAMQLLQGHPLALTWAGDLLARQEDDPEQLIKDWERAGLPALGDPHNSKRTLKWLYDRSVRGLDATEKRVLEAAGLLAHAPFPLAAIRAALGEDQSDGSVREVLRVLVRRNLLRWVPEEKDHWKFAHVLGYLNSRKETGSDSDVRTRLGRWLHAHLAATLSVGAVDDWMKRLPEDKVRQQVWLRERSVLDDRLGNVQREQGDLAGALESFRKSLEVRQRLANADASDTGWQRDLSVSHNKVGDVLSEQGDLAGALASFRRSLEVRQRLAEADASNAGWQRDLRISLYKIARLLERSDWRLGTREEALQLVEESLRIDERLSALDRSNVTWQQDVEISRQLVARLRG